MLSRPTLRHALLNERRQLPPETAKENSTLIANRLVALPVFTESTSIGVYLSINQEVDSIPVINHAWKEKKSCYLPTLKSQQLQFFRYDPSTSLRPNRFSILEPSPLTKENEILPKNLDLVLLPLVAFDTAGNRLGMGGGYYDRTFSFLRHPDSRSRPFLLGLAYEFQHIASLTPESWDVPLNAVITEKNYYEFSLSG
jgi:5-formyltetrahydrofolate cyclo-ligase